MTRAIRLAAGLAMAAPVLAGCPKSGGFKPSSPDPVIWVDQDRHDWGAIPATDTVEHIFTVRNAGGAPLNLARVQTSCGCTAAVLDKQVLEPGEETRLKVTFDPRGRNGPQSRTIWIHSNDPKTPQRQLVVQATVQSDPKNPQPQVQGFPSAAGAPAPQPQAH
jgi:hypothetical protein